LAKPPSTKEDMKTTLGGIFLYSENPKFLADWYSSNFGLTYEYAEDYKAYYISFPYLEEEGGKKRYSVFSILYNKHRPFVDGKFFTINLRVSDMEETLKRLIENKVEVRGPETHDEGIFAWANDPEGNFIEIWEDSK
jgi:predicted enzyme related to lactoylglutathione lyase